MSWRRPSDAQLKRYLLGTLDPADHASIEQRYLGDHGEFERLQLVEDELTDAYVRDELPEAERLLFERQYLATIHGRERVEAARVLMQGLAELQTPDPSPDRSADGPLSRFAWRSGRLWESIGVLPAATAIAGLALVVSLLFMAIRLDEQRRTLQAEQAEAVGRETQLRAELSQERQRLDRLSAELQQERTNRIGAQQAIEAMQPGSIVAIVLPAGLLRDAAAPPRVVKRANTTQLVLQLQLPGDGYDTYRVILRPVSAGEVWRQELSPPVPADSAGGLRVSIPAARIPPGDYLVALEGRARDGNFDGVSSYYFQVVER